jgi:hypothetical protein
LSSLVRRKARRGLPTSASLGTPGLVRGRELVTLSNGGRAVPLF